VSTLALLQPPLYCLGWSLLHFVWQGTITAILLAAVLTLIRSRSPQMRYAVTCAALALTVAFPLATFVHLARSNGVADVAMTYSAARNPTLIPGRDVNTIAEPWLGQMESLCDRALPWLLVFWFAGVVLLLGRLNVGLIVARRMKSTTAQKVSGELQRAFERVRHRLGVSRPVRLAHSAMVQVPTVIGWLRPAVLIPVGCMTGLSPTQIEAILAHELAHIRRQDYLVNMLQLLVEAVLFYHPAVWWISKQVRRERELCCDDSAVRMSGDSVAYAKALSYLEERRAALPAVALGADGGVLTMRIRRLLGYKETADVSRLAGISLLAMVVATAALGVGSFALAQSARQQPADKAIPESPYQRWVDEDVRWIITPEERAAYLKLATNEERKEFIHEFWQRRDPGAQSVFENHFRKEHYRRIAYTNVHFVTAGEAGWRTDRGRIYIVYGRPDSIDAHLVDAAKPYEVWHYREIQESGQPAKDTSGYKVTTVTRKDVDMKFVDTCACGNFELQAEPGR
jgi:GWxTD domain-containing protein